jgi:bifunctional enzyme CysN/CysC
MTALSSIRNAERVPAFARDLNGIVRLLTCGSVDDGKSTLIGRLLWDASDLYEDQRETLRRSARAAGMDGQLDYSQLVDGLVAEREQGITIDIAWRYFDTATRRFVVIDSPGHEQYTRNMASGASHADVAVMLVDARHGVKRQTRRHAAILNLVGVTRVLLAVNKMDLVGWSRQRFTEIEADFRTLVQRFGFSEAAAIPVAAVSGDNVARRSEAMPWYAGPTLIEHLERVEPGAERSGLPFRMPVQMVLRDGGDFRGLAGTVSAGTVRVGEAIVDVLSGRRAHVARIVTMSRDLERAGPGQAVVLQLDTDIDVARGAVLAAADTPPVAAARLEAQLVWLSDKGFDADTGYLLRTATDLVPVSALEIRSVLDLETLGRTAASHCFVNDIALARIELGRVAALDTFAQSPGTGSFVLVDAATGASVAGGVLAEVQPAESVARPKAFVLTRDMLERGLCAGLGTGDSDVREFRRRAREAVALLEAAGVAVEMEDLASASGR